MRQDVHTTSVETLVPEGVFIYSRTDLRGTIVEANEAFAEISGYKQSAMIGQPHNLVRHPDMPPAAFGDLWRTLKAGQTWRGLVKNRRSDGGFYWVVANVSPVREKGEIVGYQSVRSRPSREQVAAAEAAYRRIGRGDKSLRLERGQVLRVWPHWLEKLAGIEGQLSLIAVFLLVSGVWDLLSGQALVPAWLDKAAALAGLLLGCWVLLGLRRGLGRDLRAIRSALNEVVSTGRLEVKATVDRRDSVGDIGRLACSVVASMQATVQVMAVSLRQVAEAAEEVSGRMQDIERSAQVQNRATSAAAATVQQLTVSINEVAERAVETHSVADATGEVAGSGEQVMLAASSSIRELADVVNATADQVGTLSETTGEIGGIAATIKEIADQTNLLALNAAIEAARAGETGRGFAVVADEVRKLAERTREATTRIDQLIVATRRDSNLAVGGMHQGAVRVNDSVGLVGNARDSLLDINRQMGHTAVMVTDISHATVVQSKAMNELAQNVERVAEMTTRNVEVVEQAQRRVGALRALLVNLSKTVSQFQL